MKVKTTLLHCFYLSISASTALKEDSGDDGTYDDELVAREMTNALVSGILESDDGEGSASIMASIMNEDKEVAVAQFHFLKKVLKKFKKPLKHYIKHKAMEKLCRHHHCKE